MSPTSTCRGVTLIEMMVVLVLSAIALTIAVPAFDDLITRSRMGAGVVDLVSTLNRARSEAVARKRPVVVCSSGNAQGAAPACQADAAWVGGWLVYVDEDSSATLSAGDLTLAVHGAVDGIGQKTASASGVAFRSDGTAGAALAIDLCGLLRPDYGRRVAVDLSGRVRTLEVDGLCP
jgi:type IV fimbrial biogenesis protein FimT